MRTLWRNRQPFWYANYVSKDEIRDENGYLTGAYKITYTEPKKLYGNISASRGRSQFNIFGTSSTYSKVIIMESVPEGFNERTVLFIEKPVEYDENGNLLFDYHVTRVARSLNSVSVSIKEVAVDDE